MLVQAPLGRLLLSHYVEMQAFQVLTDVRHQCADEDERAQHFHHFLPATQYGAYDVRGAVPTVMEPFDHLQYKSAPDIQDPGGEKQPSGVRRKVYPKL